MRKFQNALEYYSLRGAIGFLKILPYGLSIRILAYLLLFGGKVLKIKRAVVLRQLSAVFPEKSKKEINQLADRVYFELGKSVCEIFIADEKKVFEQMEFEGLEHLEKLVAMDRGIIMVSAHFGNWEVGAKYLAQVTGKVYAVVKKQRNVLFDNYINKARLASGIETLSMKSAMRRVIAALNNKEAVGFLVDQHAGKHGIDLPFLGIETKVFNSVAKLSLKTKAPIIFAFDVRDGYYKHYCYVTEPIFTDDLEFNDKNVLDLTKQINYTIEDYIRRFPHMWLWLHRKWRNLQGGKNESNTSNTRISEP